MLFHSVLFARGNGVNRKGDRREMVTWGVSATWQKAGAPFVEVTTGILKAKTPNIKIQVI